MARRAASRSRTGNKNARYRIWQTMRVYLRSGHQWTLRDMAAVCETTPSNVRRYVAGLSACGYVRMTWQRRGQPGGDRRHVLERDTGPEAPRVRSDRSLWDPNLQREVCPDD